MSDTATSIVKYSLLAFNVLGTFGNVSLIYCTVISQKLHHKCCYIIAVQALLNILCLWNELQSYLRISLGRTQTTLVECFWCNSLYIVVYIAASYIELAIAIDRFVAVWYPMRYRSIQTRSFVITSLAPGFFLGFTFAVASFALLTDQIRPICVLPFAFIDVMSQVWYILLVVNASCVIIIYALIYSRLNCFSPLAQTSNYKQTNEQKTLLNTLFFQLSLSICLQWFQTILCSVCSTCSTFLPTATISIMFKLKLPEAVVIDAETYAVLPALIAYSSAYYVFFWRSKEYRSAFMEMFACRKLRIQPGGNDTRVLVTRNINTITNNRELSTRGD